jgi:hypothetical protein
MAEITCLEKRGDEARNEQIVRSDYNFNDQYSANHPDALSTGDSRGKGTGSTGHGDSLPDCNAPINVFNYSNFDTSYESHPGNNVDNEARNKAMVKSKYSAATPYGDVQFNGQQGQYFVP